jgi:Zn-dependent peptidase ImmA (M78 family)
MLSGYSREELAVGLDAVAMELLAEANVDGPPVDAFLLARRLGITVAVDDLQQGRARYVRLGGRRPSRLQPTILFRSDPRCERQQWALAHEIGEHAACRVFTRWGVDVREIYPRAREEVANHLAGRLLLPTAWFATDAAECGWDLIALKGIYATASHELIARRMLDCPPPVIITIFDHRTIYFRRGNLPGHVPPLSAAETKCWRMVHEGSQPRQTYDGVRTVQGWPVHEPEWKREVLRAEVDECEVEVG